jgi:hypothetical protein
MRHLMPNNQRSHPRVRRPEVREIDETKMPTSPYAERALTLTKAATSLICHLGIETRKIQPLWAESSSGKHTPRNPTSTGFAASRQSEAAPT